MAAEAEDPDLGRWRAGRSLSVGIEQAGRHWLADDCLGLGRQSVSQEMLSSRIRHDIWSDEPGQ